MYGQVTSCVYGVGRINRENGSNNKVRGSIRPNWYLRAQVNKKTLEQGVRFVEI